MNNQYVVVDARVGYPWSSLEIWVEKQPVKKFAVQSFPQQITLSLFSPHEDQQEAGRQSVTPRVSTPSAIASCCRGLRAED